MSEPVFVLEGDKPVLKRHGPSGWTCFRSREAILDAYVSHKRAVWVARTTNMDLSFLAAHAGGLRVDRRLLVLSRVAEVRRELLQALFGAVLRPQKTLPQEELTAVLESPKGRDLFIGGTVDKEAEVLVLCRGDLTQVIVPFSWFTVPEGGPRPNWDKFEVIDFGHTVKLGSYEAATDAILYDFDPDYRRRAKDKEIAGDRSFGGALKRLRLLRGLSQGDLGLSRKQISRIERGETEKPHGATLEKIAKHLRVKPEEIETY